MRRHSRSLAATTASLKTSRTSRGPITVAHDASTLHQENTSPGAGIVGYRGIVNRNSQCHAHGRCENTARPILQRVPLDDLKAHVIWIEPPDRSATLHRR